MITTTYSSCLRIHSDFIIFKVQKICFLIFLFWIYIYFSFVSFRFFSSKQEAKNTIEKENHTKKEKKKTRIYVVRHWVTTSTGEDDRELSLWKISDKYNNPILYTTCIRTPKNPIPPSLFTLKSKYPPTIYLQENTHIQETIRIVFLLLVLENNSWEKIEFYLW